LRHTSAIQVQPLPRGERSQRADLQTQKNKPIKRSRDVPRRRYNTGAIEVEPL